MINFLKTLSFYLLIPIFSFSMLYLFMYFKRNKDISSYETFVNLLSNPLYSISIFLLSPLLLLIFIIVQIYALFVIYTLNKNKHKDKKNPRVWKN